MKKFNHFIKQSVIGGILVILPSVIIYFAFRWAFRTVTDIIEPITNPIVNRTNAPEIAVDLLVILLILVGCFFVGTLASTGVGKWLHLRFDKSLAMLAPGYNIIRDIIHQLLGDNENSPFRRGDVAIVQVMGGAMTGIVTSRHLNGHFTVFVPTGPNPTTGMIFHLPPEQVELMPGVKVEDALRTILSCGAGSAELFRPRSPINT